LFEPPLFEFAPSHRERQVLLALVDARLHVHAIVGKVRRLGARHAPARPGVGSGVHDHDMSVRRDKLGVDVGVSRELDEHLVLPRWDNAYELRLPLRHIYGLRLGVGRILRASGRKQARLVRQGFRSSYHHSNAQGAISCRAVRAKVNRLCPARPRPEGEDGEGAPHGIRSNQMQRYADEFRSRG